MAKVSKVEQKRKKALKARQVVIQLEAEKNVNGKLEGKSDQQLKQSIGKLLVYILAFSFGLFICRMIVGSPVGVANSPGEAEIVQPSMDKKELSLEEIRDLVKPIELRWSEWQKEEEKAGVDSKKSWNNFLEDLLTFQERDFRDRLHDELTKTWSEFRRIMAETKNDVKSRVHYYSIGLRLKIWFAVARYDGEIERHRPVFKTKLMAAYHNDVEKGDDVMKGKFAVALVEYFAKVNGTVNEFLNEASNILSVLNRKIEQSVEEAKEQKEPKKDFFANLFSF